MPIVSASPLRLVASHPIAFDTPGLNNGVRLGFGQQGTILYDCGLYIPTAFDGTTPKGDIGLFQGGDTAGLFGESQGVLDLTAVDGDTFGLNGFVTPGVASLLTQLVHASNNPALPLRITAPGPLLVVASQTGAKGGAAVGGSAGVLIAWAVIAG